MDEPTCPLISPSRTMFPSSPYYRDLFVLFSKPSYLTSVASGRKKVRQPPLRSLIFRSRGTPLGKSQQRTRILTIKQAATPLTKLANNKSKGRQAQSYHDNAWGDEHRTSTIIIVRRHRIVIVSWWACVGDGRGAVGVNAGGGVGVVVVVGIKRGMDDNYY